MKLETCMVRLNKMSSQKVIVLPNVINNRNKVILHQMILPLMILLLNLSHAWTMTHLVTASGGLKMVSAKQTPATC
jgi:hypothetical protein